MLSKHLPEVAGGTVAVTGSLVVDTGLRDLQSFSATIQGVVVLNEESLVTYELVDQIPGTTRQVTIRVYKAGPIGHGSVGDSAMNVTWMAIGN